MNAVFPPPGFGSFANFCGGDGGRCTCALVTGATVFDLGGSGGAGPGMESLHESPLSRKATYTKKEGVRKIFRQNHKKKKVFNLTASLSSPQNLSFESILSGNKGGGKVVQVCVSLEII